MAQKLFPVHLRCLLVVIVSLLTPIVSSAQQADAVAPTLVHRPALSGGAVGDLQTFVARVSDDSEFTVTLHYRQGPSNTFSEIRLRKLADSIDEYMIAIETDRQGGQQLDYYLQATDVAGNVSQRGSASEPLVISLQPPAAVPPRQASAPVAEPAPNRAALWIAGAAAILAVGLLAGSGSSGGGDSGNNVNLTIFSPTPNVE